MHPSPQAQDAPLSQPADACLDPQSQPLAFTDDGLDEDHDAIFLKAVAEIDTQPLSSAPQEVYWPMVFLLVLFFCSYVGGTIIALLTYPTVTITVVPVTKRVVLTTPLALATRALVPVTLTKSLTTDTTGKGHQDARAARGILTFYNGLFSAQRLPGGTVFTGADGIQVATDAAMTIPAGNPPSYGQASIQAHALHTGSAGNIAAGDINATVSSSVLVKNGPFSGGQDARDFPAVAQADLDHLTSTLEGVLNQQMPQAFVLRPGEAVQLAVCAFKSMLNHTVGDEAQTITLRVTETCKGVAYNNDQLSQQATTLFLQQTSPGPNYELIGEVKAQLVSMTPVTVSCRGLWAYNPSPDYKQFLAQQIAGDNPQQAKKYLLQTGFLTQALVPEQLPRDPAHIHFKVLIGL